MGDILQMRPRRRAQDVKDLPPNEKRDALVRIMEMGAVAMVHLDARRDGVVVPAQYRGDHHLCLNLSWRYRTRIEFTAEIVNAVLSFDGMPYPCEIPYSAIYAVSSDRFPAMNEVYLKDLPTEILAHSTVKPA